MQPHLKQVIEILQKEKCNIHHHFANVMEKEDKIHIIACCTTFINKLEKKAETLLIIPVESILSEAIL